MMTFNVDDFEFAGQNRYARRIAELKASGRFVGNIEKAVDDATKNLKDGSTSFVIYGEPQSGKTEMMIALTARLLDEGHRIVVVLLNDNVQLLTQNLDRFRRSGLDPAPRNFLEILDTSVDIKSSEHVIFCKKNASDLQKLLNKLGKSKVVIIDDEADYASPNSKINKQERTKINALINTLLGTEGTYIGVTATPARLDLNNTFENEGDRWVDFPPHPDYKGPDVFFPASVGSGLGFELTLLPDHGDSPEHLRRALFGFLVNVAYLNRNVNPREINYSMLIHTSGNRADHTDDYQQIVSEFNILKNRADKKFAKHYQEIFELAKKRYLGHERTITQYIMDNVRRYAIVIMNSDSDRATNDFGSATDPATLFTVAIGGNIVSRGVTFERLLSMFFTRDVKHKIQQDTYIQRARMFGSRGQYLPFFELTIPSTLYLDWHKCFIFHKLALETRRSGNRFPVWLEDRRIAAAAASSIDRSRVVMDSGEMSFEKFRFAPELDAIANSAVGQQEKVSQFAEKVPKAALPPYLLDFIRRFSQGDQSIAVHASQDISNYKDASADVDQISRSKGFMGTNQLELPKYPDAVHHLKIFRNNKGEARIFYKYMGNIRFLKNLGFLRQ